MQSENIWTALQFPAGSSPNLFLPAGGRRLHLRFTSPKSHHGSAGACGGGHGSARTLYSGPAGRTFSFSYFHLI